jgi:hypothetical protein
VNSQRITMTRELLRRGFTPAIADGTPTHRDGNHLDQVWVKNVELVRAVIAEEMLEWSDHRLIKVVEGAEVTHRRDAPRSEIAELTRVPLSTFPQSSIKLIMNDPETLKHLEVVDLRERPIIEGVPAHIVSKYAPKRLPDKPGVRYHKSKSQPM